MLCIALLFSTGDSYASAISTLYSGTIANCDAPGLENLFSGFVCKYQEIVDAILTQLYYGMLDYFRRPFWAAMILFTITVGATFALGILPFTTRDIMLVLAKIAILSGFAMYPTLMIDLFYNGLVGFMQETTDTVVAALANTSGSGITSVPGIFEWMDEKLYEFIALQDTAQTEKNCDSDLLAFLFGLAVTMPPVFAMAIYLLFQLMMTLVRTVLGYLLAMTGIMFLTTLAPLFFGFALFKFSNSYFTKWLQYIIGFSVQIFVVFAFIAAVLGLPFESKLQGVLSTIQPYDETAFHDGQRLDFNDWCTLCASNAFGQVTTPDSCTGDAITPTNVQVGGVGEWINWIGKEILILGVMAYLVESILKAAPEVSKYLTSLPHSPAFAGKLPLAARLDNSITGGIKAFRDGPGGVIGKSSAATNTAAHTLLTGRPPIR